MTKWNRRDWAILLGITALAAALRFIGLGRVPPGFQFDEAYNALDAARVMAGDRPLFLPTNGGREVFYTYLQVALASVLGLNLHTLRLTSALAGILAAPSAYLLLRGLLTLKSRQIAAFTSLVLAISFWHLHFSHYAIRIILMPVIFSGVVGFFWYATRVGRVWPYLLSGVLAGIGVWNNPTGRLIPLVLLGYVLWLLWQHPDQRTLRWPSPVTGLLLTGLTSFVVFLPLGLEFYRHPEFFFGHPDQVSVFADRVSGGSPVVALLENAVRVTGMFSIQGDREWIHNLGGRPLFDPLLSIAFWIGIAVWLLRLSRRDDVDRDALFFLLLWSVVMLLPSVFSDAAPNFSRTLPALPALFVAAGLGLTWILTFVSGRWSPLAGRILVSGVLVISGVWAAIDYFVRFPRAIESYYAYDVDKLDALAYLKPLTADNQVYLSQLWAEHATLEFLRGETGIKSLDTSDTIVLPPPDRAALYAFPAEQADRATAIQKRWPSADLQTIQDRHGNPLLVTVGFDAADAAAETSTGLPIARFQQGPSLVDMAFDPDAAKVVLTWEAEQSMDRSLTSFVHLVDASGRRVGQIDKTPGNGSYPTSVWTPGERVIETYRIDLDVCAGGQEAGVVTGWYQYSDEDGVRRLARSDGVGDTALAGHVQLPISSFGSDHITLANMLREPVSEGLMLTGFQLTGAELQPGAPFTLDLAWEGDPDSGTESMAIYLIDSGKDNQLLWQESLLPPDARWWPGEVICRRLNMRLPEETGPGRYQLIVDVAGNSVPLTELAIQPSSRLFSVPPLSNRTDAVIGDRFTLLGYDISLPEPDQPAMVTLVWRAEVPTEKSYTVFVHLVDSEDQIVAQSDAIPGQGYSTNHWINGEVVLDAHPLVLPDELPSGAYRLLAGMYDSVEGERLPAWDAHGNALQDGIIVLEQLNLP
ncbi:MAG: phospholipid carrier-dependent glycosyltransferase [Chloroflexota bacterium]|nr:phospholipid carrier-dependent glycosyltransferase [Chloroflexota bacterium]